MKGHQSKIKSQLVLKINDLRKSPMWQYYKVPSMYKSKKLNKIKLILN